MRMNELIETIEHLDGNLQRGKSVYISVDNMKLFSDYLVDINAQQGILLTPYLIKDGEALYELHSYEFEIDIRDEVSHFNEYNPRNCLEKEVTQNLKPQAIIRSGDSKFYYDTVRWYLVQMGKMKFSEAKEHYPILQEANLFYQIFMDSDEY
jgi:hypothetical protein